MIISHFGIYEIKENKKMKRLFSFVILVMTFALVFTSCSMLSEVAGIHTVKLDLGDEALNEEIKDSMIVMDGKFAKLPTPTKEGYTFAGWFTEEGELVTTETPITSNLNLVAKWKKNEYKLDFDLGDFTDDSFENNANVPGEGFELPTPTREGYDFLGWYTNDGELFTEDMEITADMKLVAKWQIKSYVVVFVDFYGNVVSTETVEYGSSITAPSVDAIIGNQRFVEWNKDLSFIKENMTVSPVYSDNTYTITYNCGEVTESFTGAAFMGEIPKVPKAPEADGYVFFGWYIDEELTERYFFDYKFDEDTTLYAKFYDTSLGEYIVISNVNQLMAIYEQPDAKYLLACDINCKGETLIPIDEFTGEIDGNGYKIHNFAINEDANVVGFIRMNKGMVMNLTFSDFIFDVLMTTGSDKFYGIVCGKNEGTIYNCHSDDGEMKVDCGALCYSFSIFIGGLAGTNSGLMDECTNSSVISAKLVSDGGYWSGSGYMSAYVGGICGRIDAGTVSNCVNDAFMDISNSPLSTYGGYYSYIGGIAALIQDNGVLKQSANLGDMKITNLDYNWIWMQLGGAVGRNYGGKIENCYVICDMVIENVGTNEYNNIVGGFVGYNTGKIYNCYSVVDLKDNTPTLRSIGGFVGFNELLSGHEAHINKCFSMGSIELTGTPTNVGALVAESTGTIKYGYYVDTFEINKKVVTKDENGEDVETLEPVEPTVNLGEAKAESELLSLDFLAETLYFDREVWYVYEGVLPTLR